MRVSCRAISIGCSYKKNKNLAWLERAQYRWIQNVISWGPVHIIVFLFKTQTSWYVFGNRPQLNDWKNSFFFHPKRAHLKRTEFQWSHNSHAQMMVVLFSHKGSPFSIVLARSGKTLRTTENKMTWAYREYVEPFDVVTSCYVPLYRRWLFLKCNFRS